MRSPFCGVRWTFQFPLAWLALLRLAIHACTLALLSLYTDTLHSYVPYVPLIHPCIHLCPPTSFHSNICPPSIHFWIRFSVWSAAAAVLQSHALSQCNSPFGIFRFKSDRGNALSFPSNAECRTESDNDKCRSPWLCLCAVL
jgi:hypothetical protein